jgi:arsenate reductase (thioredoxin)
VDAVKVLFICVGNACRSPMAEAIASVLGGERVEAHSAGLSATGQIAPHTVSALRELGYPTDRLRSKSLAAVPLSDMDVIVSLIGSQGLAILPRNLGAECLAWAIRDPMGEDLEAFLAAARLIERRVRDLVRELVGELPVPG